MKKSLIAVAVASAFVAPAAMAEVTISGAINVGITAIKSGADTAGNKGITRTSLANNYSHIDIESVDDIGGGNKIVMHYQMQTNPGGLGDTPTNRNSFLGVIGTWGAFKMGTNENVYERWMYESDPLDGAVGLGGSIQMLGHSGRSGSAWFITDNVKGDQFWRRTSNTVSYESPNMGGFTFEIDHTLSAFKTNGGGTTFAVDPQTGLVKSVTTTASDPTITSIGGQFKPDAAPFFVNVGYERHKDVTNSLGGGSDKATAWQVGGGYTIADLTLFARYERISYKAIGGTLYGAPTDKLDVKHYWVAAKYNLPSGYLGAEIGLAPNLKVAGGDVSQTKARMYSLGYFHNLSKQSQLQLIATRISNDAKINYGIGAGTGSVNGDGADYSGFTVGLKHTF